MYSVYHLFRSLSEHKKSFGTARNLDRFPFDNKMLSCRNKGVFPDLAIRLNKKRDVFTGGELIELKDSKSYTVSSFNSTIPVGSKAVADIITGEHSRISRQMKRAGNDIFSLPEREVYYLVRGRKRENTKVCLTRGSFFETVVTKELINQSFLQVLEERLKQSNVAIPQNIREVLASISFEQENFSKVRSVNKASVNLRFRIMTEVNAEGNLLNTEKYPEIPDNTLNLVLPCHNDAQEKDVRNKFVTVFGTSDASAFRIFKMKHHFNGWFLVFQTGL